MMATAPRKFEAKPATLTEVPLLIGIVGPPGGGKTMSALRLATGMKTVRPGPVVLIDTESGRAMKYAPQFDFLHVDFKPPFTPEEFLNAVKQQQKHDPAAIIIDSLSDEHEGDGGVLDWHDQDVPKMGGNEWAAWAKPKASRRKMINGFLQIKTPLIFTFRAREKTKTEKVNGKNVPVNIGYQPVAPAEIIYALDLTCILPPRANGVPVWKSEKAGEDFIIKLPKYLQHCFRDNEALNEKTGELLARWARGGENSGRADMRPAVAGGAADRAAPADAGGAELTEQEARDALRAAATNGMKALETEWTATPNGLRRGLIKELDGLKAIATEVDLRSEAKHDEPADQLDL